MKGIHLQNTIIVNFQIYNNALKYMKPKMDIQEETDNHNHGGNFLTYLSQKPIDQTEKKNNKN